jgi:hypothetical protein
MLMEIYRSAMARRAQETVVRAAPAAAREN